MTVSTRRDSVEPSIQYLCKYDYKSKKSTSYNDVDNKNTFF